MYLRHHSQETRNCPYQWDKKMPLCEKTMVLSLSLSDINIPSILINKGCSSPAASSPGWSTALMSQEKTREGWHGGLSAAGEAVPRLA